MFGCLTVHYNFFFLSAFMCVFFLVGLLKSIVCERVFYVVVFTPSKKKERNNKIKGSSICKKITMI